MSGIVSGIVSAPALDARVTVEVGRDAARFAVEAELSLERGVLVLFGPSGVGKTLTLSALAGLLRPSRGRIVVSGETLFDAERRVEVPAHARRIGYVPQHQALFPHLDVLGNVVFGLPRRDRRRVPERVTRLLDELGLTRLARAMPGSLSGGERQRVALARALAVEPRLVLLDEPFAAIDREGRATLRSALAAALRARDTPAVLVTHDPEDARVLGDRVVLFERGRSIRAGTPGALLGDDDLVLTARAGALTPAEGGARLALEGAVLEGPADALEELADGEHRFVVRPSR